MDNKKVYENFDWGEFKYKALEDKVKRIVESIPNQVESIVDIGCGNGLITNILGQKYDVTAVDRSEHALSFVKTKKINSSNKFYVFVLRNLSSV
ncbi:MAG: class I SAM-dependent methyltransferase [Flavobacteriaceae bacterium]|nr:class I SAM-dependent methyltransferase [Flavobacteriaceae bacterium]